MKRIDHGRDRTRKQKGSYLVLGAFVMTTLILTAGLGVDIARKFHLEQRAQDVADAASIAGARMLPNVAVARSTVVRYIQQAAGTGYVPWDSDVQIVVDTRQNNGTVGVLVTGAWDPIIMPAWLLGDPTYGVARYAIADMNWETTRVTVNFTDTFGRTPPSNFAIFVGDTLTSSALSGNSIFLNGKSHFNSSVTFSNHGQNISTDSITAASHTGGGGLATKLEAGVYTSPPVLDRASLVWDVTLDQNDAAQRAYYSVARPLLGANGQPVANVTCRWDGAQWVITASNNVTSALSGQTANWGVGVDVNIIGMASVHLPQGTSGGNQNFWLGSMQSTGRMLITSNNSEIRSVRPQDATLRDNPGLALSPGYTLAANQIALDNGGNALNVYGLVHTSGRVQWTGNMNNYNAGFEGTPGNYDAVGNGFIKGSVICGSLNSEGNNFKVYYDAGWSGVPPRIREPIQSPDRFSTPTVWLRR